MFFRSNAVPLYSSQNNKIVKVSSFIIYYHHHQHYRYYCYQIRCFSLKGKATYRKIGEKKALCLDGTPGTYATTTAVAIQKTSFTIGIWLRIPRPPKQISHFYM